MPLLLLAAACVAHPRPQRSLDGAIGGLTRDPATGDAIGFTVIHLRGAHRPELTTTATHEGLFGFDHLAPGRYNLYAEAGSAHAAIANIDVTGGAATVVDVELLLGSGAARDFSGDQRDAAIEHFTPSHHDPTTSVIEGAIADVTSRRRIAGAVITAIGPNNNTLQTVSDDAGRYRFDPVPPGTYTISASYSLEGHGEIELRRSEIAVEAAHGVRVPLWVETRR